MCLDCVRIVVKGGCGGLVERRNERYNGRRED